MNLEQLQRAFQQHVLHGDAAIAESVNATPQVPAAIRLGIYVQAYRLRLIEALAHNYPRLQQLLGTEAFAALAQRYLDTHPSTSVSVRWFGQQLAADLNEDQEQPWLAQLARWEWAIAAAFDAQDTEPLNDADLHEIDPAAWPALRFQFHPSLQQIVLHSNVASLFKALSDDTECPKPAMLEAPQAWLIWREKLTARYRSLTDEEAQALDTLRNGGTFAQLCEALCEWHEPASVPAQAAVFLKGWVDEGLIVGVFEKRMADSG